jgi:hypothetical protein
MRKPSRDLVLSVPVVIGLCGGHSVLAGAERADAFPVIVVVHDRAQVFPRTLDQALKEAARIYRQAGVATEWLMDPTRASGVSANTDRPSVQAFTVQLIIQPNLRMAGHRPSKFLMGAAPRTSRDCGGSVYVFLDQIAEFSSVQRIDPALAMGTVIAHEVGHHLLRQHGHSAEGVMRSSWDSNDWRRAARGFLLFSSDDAATIRATSSSCRQGGRD